MLRESAPALTVATWNLQGSCGVDVPSVAARLRALAPGEDGPDIVLLQEVQRPQARALASALAARSHVWAFKHWPVVRKREGLAVLARHRLVASRPLRIQSAPFWSWRRRIILLVRVATPLGEVALADVHLSPHDLDLARRVQAVEVVAALTSFAGSSPSIVAGDFNDLPGTTAHALLTGAGWADAWLAVHGGEDGAATNWTEGERAGRPPTQRLDYVLVSPSWTADRAVVPQPGAQGYDDWAALSDHLPLCVTVRPSRPGPPGS